MRNNPGKFHKSYIIRTLYAYFSETIEPTIKNKVLLDWYLSADYRTILGDFS